MNRIQAAREMVFMISRVASRVTICALAAYGVAFVIPPLLTKWALSGNWFLAGPGSILFVIGIMGAFVLTLFPLDILSDVISLFRTKRSKP